MECLSKKGKEINEILSDTEYIFLKRFSKWFCSKLEISELQKNPFRFVRCELFLYKEHRVRFTIRFIESKEEIES